MTIKELYEIAINNGVENEQIIIDDSDWGYNPINNIYKNINPNNEIEGVLLEWDVLPLNEHDWVPLNGE